MDVSFTDALTLPHIHTKLNASNIHEKENRLLLYDQHAWTVGAAASVSVISEKYIAANMGAVDCVSNVSWYDIIRNIISIASIALLTRSLVILEAAYTAN